MTLWIVLTAMTTIVAVWAAMPFLRRPGEGETSDHAATSSAVYRDQLRQIDAELEAGVINEAEALATRSEVARRLVLAERDEKARSQPAQIGDRSFAAVGIAGAVALGSAILYVKLGEPGLIPGPQNAAVVASESRGELPARHPAVAAAQSQAASRAQAQGDREGGNIPSVDGMIERLVQRLKANPEDPEGWRVLGWSYATQGRFKEAMAAYEEAIKRQPENGDLYASLGEILVRAGNGVVSTDAMTAFEDALKRDRSNARARFFLGLKKEQSGDRKAALDDWITMLQDASPGEPWTRDLTERVEQLAAELKVDLAGRLPVVPSTAETGNAGPGAMGTAQNQPQTQSPATIGAGAVGSTETAAADDQSAMIRNMVDGLAARLEQQPRDLEGWSRLIRSRVVLGETEKAKSALAKARTIFADTPEALAVIGATSRELRLEP